MCWPKWWRWWWWWGSELVIHPTICVFWPWDSGVVFNNIHPHTCAYNHVLIITDHTAQWSYLECQNSDSASSSIFHQLALFALLMVLVSHSSPLSLACGASVAVGWLSGFIFCHPINDHWLKLSTRYWLHSFMIWWCWCHVNIRIINDLWLGLIDTANVSHYCDLFIWSCKDITTQHPSIWNLLALAIKEKSFKVHQDDAL